MMKISQDAQRVRRAVDVISRNAPNFKPDIAIVLGSGLGGAIPHLKDQKVIPYTAIPGFFPPSVPGHVGRLLLGRFGRKNVVVLQGRSHYYEGISPRDVVFPMRVLAFWGIQTVILTAAAGSLRPAIRPGHFVVVSDHINLTGHNPLRGQHCPEFGAMFPSLENAYDRNLRRTIAQACVRNGAVCHPGVYVAVSGPSYESPAEIRAFRRLGGDVVGMSIAFEAIAARQAGLRTAALAWCSNMGAGLPGASQDHDEVLALGQKTGLTMRSVLERVIAEA